MRKDGINQGNNQEDKGGKGTEHDATTSMLHSVVSVCDVSIKFISVQEKMWKS